MKLRITKLMMVAAIVALVLVAGNTAAWAQNDGPPAVTGATGPVILDLAGKPIPSGGNGTYQQYTAEFTATGSSVTVMFAFRDDAADISLANASATDLTNPSGNLLLNSSFTLGTVGSTPMNWSYSIGTAQAYGGVVGSGSDCYGAGYCWFDGSLQGYDTISQTITTTPGDNYQISFYVAEDSACKTGNGAAISPCNFSDQSNNGDTTDSGGDGIDVVLYASGATLPTSQTLTLTLLYPGTGQVTDNTGAMICSEAGGIVQQTISGVPTVEPLATCTATYPYGTIVTLYEAPNEPSASTPASTFAGWGGACPGTAKGGNECILTMDSSQNATAGFAIPGQIVTLPVAPGQSQTYGYNQGSGQTPYDFTVLNNGNTTFGVTVNPISISQSDCNAIVDPSFPGANCFVYQLGASPAVPPDSAVMFEITCPSSPGGTCGSAQEQNFLATLGSDFTFSVPAPNSAPPVTFTQENPPLFLAGSASPIYGPLEASGSADPNPYVGFLKGAGPDPLHPCTPFSAATNPGATQEQLDALNAAMFSNQIVSFTLADTTVKPATGKSGSTGSCWIISYLTLGEVPTVSLTQPTNNGIYQQGETDSTTTANYTCNAVNAGDSSQVGPYLTVASCSANDSPGGSVAQGAQFDTATIGPHTFTATVVDSATNTASSTVTYYVLGPQTITFATPASAAYGSSFNVAATGGASGNPVVFTSSGSCTGGGSGNATITMTSGTGTCSVIANQAGNNTSYAAATQVTQIVNATLATPTVTFTGAPANAAYGSSFTVATTTNASTAAVITASGACSNSGTTVNMTSGTGTCSLLATWAADSNYSGTTANQSTSASKIAPTVTFTGAPANAAYGSSFTVATTTNASTAAVITSSGACSNSGTTVNMTSGTGTCSLLATWAADSNYSGTTANQSTSASKIAPTVTFTGAPASAAYGASFTVATTTNASTAAVITSSGACSNTGTTVNMTSGTGTCSLLATWAADSNYSGTTANQSTTANKIAPTVTFKGAPANAAYGSSFTVATTTNASTAAVITASGACSNSGTTVNMTSGTGTCSLLATWAADSNYSGTTANQSTTANKIAPTVTFTGAPASAAYGASFTVATTTNASTAAVITASGACSNSGTTVNMTSGTGTCSLLATWAADSNYSGTTANQSTNATLVKQTITVTTTPPASATYGSNFPVAATASSGLGVAITSSGSCSGSGTGSATITITSSTGTCSVMFNQAGNSNYSAAPMVTDSVTVGPPVTLTPSTVNFPTTRAGRTSTAQVTLTNTGNVTLKNISVKVSESDSDEFTATSCSSTLAAGAKCTITVTYHADSDDKGGTTAKLVVTESAPSPYNQLVTILNGTSN